MSFIILKTITHHIERSDSAGHEESSTKGREELSGETLGDQAGLGDHALDLIVASHLGAVENLKGEGGRNIVEGNEGMR